MPGNVATLAFATALLILGSVELRADDSIRAVQEELRKRNLYYGDVDGRQTPSFLEALKKYQERKGFAVTGEPDADTLRSMGISVPEAGSDLPDVPILRSDRSMNSDRAATEAPAPQPPRPSAPAPDRAEMAAWLKGYLEACQTTDIGDELGYYAENVDYFHHGTVTRTDIGRELSVYAQQWPTRRYLISGPVTVKQSDENTIVRSRINFELQAGSRRASGKVDNAFTVARRPDLTWEIIGHEEERVRQAARSKSSKRRKNSSSISPLDRTLRKFFGPSQKRKR